MSVFTGLVSIPLGVLSPKVKKDLTVKWRDIEGQKLSLQMWHPDGDQIWVPRDYGISVCAGGEHTYSHGEGIPYALPPVKLKPEQGPWVEEICRWFQKNHDLIAQAGVGKGKTVMSLEIARRLDTVPLILVDQDFLKNQWIERAKEFWGLDDEDIGIVQGPTCDYKDKSIVVAMIQSLYQKEYDAAFYEYFGLVILDEVHVVGAPMFSRVLGRFNPRYRLGVSATPKRGDALDQVLKAHLGPVRVRMDHLHDPSQVRIVEYTTGCPSWYASVSKMEGRFVSDLSGDTDRNMLMVEVIHTLWERGRKILVIGGRIEQLHALMEMAIAMGVERDDCGLVCGNENNWQYTKDSTPKLKPVGWDGESDYTPVQLGVCTKTIKRDVLEARKKRCRIIFSTYGMFAKGVDVPRLDAGIDVTPRAKAQQVHGRILRPQEGKLMPIWVTIRDTVSYRCEFQLANRLKEYAENNAEVYLWRLDKGLRRLNRRELQAKLFKRAKALQEAKILTRRDGRNIVMIESTGKVLNAARSKPTEKRTRKRRVRSLTASV